MVWKRTSLWGFRMQGTLREGMIYVKEKVDKLYRQGFGEIVGGELELHVVEAAYLVQYGKLRVFEGGEEYTLSRILSMLDGEQFLKFIVYSDLRRRGRVVVYERATPFLRLYPPGRKIGESPAKNLVMPLSEDSPVKHKLILDTVERVARLRKKLILAVVDDEMNVTYYLAENFMPTEREISWKIPSHLFEGKLVGDRVLVTEERAGELYKEGFWGHPLGVEKPRPGELYRSPVQLPLIEAIYLNKREVLKVYRKERELKPEELSKLHEKYRFKARIKERVYTYWRDLGFIPKAGSKFGADFLIYERGPGLEHAPYLCLAGDVNEDIRPVDLIRAGRLATSVRKDLVVSLVSGDGVVSYRVRWFKP